MELIKFNQSKTSIKRYIFQRIFVILFLVQNSTSLDINVTSVNDEIKTDEVVVPEPVIPEPSGPQVSSTIVEIKLETEYNEALNDTGGW